MEGRGALNVDLENTDLERGNILQGHSLQCDGRSVSVGGAAAAAALAGSTGAG